MEVTMTKVQDKQFYMDPPLTCNDFGSLPKV
jgi:hypothetical protein